MKIILITPGTGSYYCGVCMRDNALARELIRQGHDAVMLPMYLPLTLDEPPAGAQRPMFFGGINVYLQQKFAWFRNGPRWLDQWLNHPALLRLAGKKSGMTGGAELGELTLSMLRGEEGYQAREVDKLVEWLVTEEKPDAIWLSTALLVGLARRLKSALGVPVLCSLQGEDAFLDGLAAPWSARCWETLAERSRDVDRFIAPSRYYAQEMAPRMRLADSQLRVIANGISLEGFEGSPSAPSAPTIGYLARMVEGKGLGLVVDAFIWLKREPRFAALRLRCAGAMTPGDEVFVSRLRGKLAAAGCAADAEFLPNVTREQKLVFLRELTLFSVPALLNEAFGLYVIEAFASGIPVVLPRAAAFVEMVEASGAGLLCEPGSVESLAQGWAQLLDDPARALELGRRGRSVAQSHYSMEPMAHRFLALTREIIDGETPTL
jgi:glycosyltransferase involved in cell wall biosynthesis